MDSVLRDLIQTATAKTQQGRLRWKAFDSESFRAAIGSGYLHVQRLLARIEDDDGDSRPATTFSAQVSDEQGRVVAEAEAQQGFGGSEDCTILAALFEAARKSTFKSDKVIEDMLAALRGS